MARIHGWLFVDKPSGLTSRDVVNLISRSLKEKKVGHAGTLDPMASGLLAVAIGEATKSIFVMQNMPKCYRFKVKWGISTSTDDEEGQILSVSNNRPTRLEILNILPLFLGKINQIPPKFSALKLNGIRSYKLARENIQFELKPRLVNVHEIKLTNFIDTNFSEFKILCSKGTYVRSIARDMGVRLNTCSHIVQLRRESIGKYSTKNAILLDLSKNLIHSPLILNSLVSLNDFLKALPSICLTKEEAKKIKNGQKLNLNYIKNKSKFLDSLLNDNQLEDVYCYFKNIPVAFARIEENLIRPFKVFNV